MSLHVELAIMNTQTHEHWLDSILPRHERLTKAVVSIVENLLGERNIDYLAVTGRTKDKRSAIEKIRRKGYSDPHSQLTDLSGIRIVVYFESDVQRVSELIDQAFHVDRPNSLDKDLLLSTNQIGYRSVHYVCDLGTTRAIVEEYKGLSQLKFEFQVRTVLQHAWAELAHDRNYKFSGKLPRDLERKLYLYAGLLEIADRGFDETAKAIDVYADSLQTRTSRGDLDIEITSLSLDAYVNLWAARNNYKLVDVTSKDDLGELVQELNDFGIARLFELEAIIPKDYTNKAKTRRYETSIYGVVRDWMLIKDWRKFARDVTFNWVMDRGNILDTFFAADEYEAFKHAFEWADDDDEEDGTHIG